MSDPREKPDAKPAKGADDPAIGQPNPDAEKPRTEIGGRKGPDPVRYGDWEKGGRAIDF